MTGTRDTAAFLYRAITANGWVVAMTEAGRLREPPRPDVSESSLVGFEAFSPNARLQARRMGEIYELLYCLENSVRELVESTLSEALGADKWWNGGVDPSIRRAAERRKQDDLKARWHGPRGASLLNYVDFPQYADIIAARWDAFEPLLGDLDWVTYYFGEMNRTRRALAHTGSLTELDVDRLRLRVREWLQVVG